MPEDVEQFRERFIQQSDEDLIRMVTEDAHEYRTEALDAARQELARRGVSISDDEEDEDFGARDK